jgi:ATP-dependent Zn protease
LDDRPSPRNQISRWLPFAAAALIGVWLLQGVAAPLLPRAADIPYSDFKRRLAAGQVTDVTLGYLGTAVVESSDASAATHETIDAEVRRIVGEQFERAATLVAAHRDALGKLSADLLKAESLDGSAVRESLSGTGHAALRALPSTESEAAS